MLHACNLKKQRPIYQLSKIVYSQTWLDNCRTCRGEQTSGVYNYRLNTQLINYPAAGKQGCSQDSNNYISYSIPPSITSNGTDVRH